MSWHPLSSEGTRLLRELEIDSRAWIGRAERTERTLRALSASREVAAIPALFEFLLDCDFGVARSVIRTLQDLFLEMPSVMYPNLDEQVRKYHRWSGPNERRRTLSQRKTDRLRAEPSASLPMGLASCDISGYLRESAVQMLDRRFQDGSEIPFLLLRLDDWVEPVRLAAETAIAGRLAEAHRPGYLRHLPLIFRLRGRERATRSSIFAGLQHLLGSVPGDLIEAAMAGGAATRRAGLSLAWKAAQAGAESVQVATIEQILAFRAPAARLQAVRWLTDVSIAPELAWRFLPQLANDRQSAIKRLALEWRATVDPQGSLEWLRKGLLDPSAKVRTIAQFHLGKLQPLELGAYYREALLHGTDRDRDAAIGGLMETGAKPDAELIAAFAEAPQISLRKAAIAALGRIAPEDYLEILWRGLQDASPGICRQARQALEPLAPRMENEPVASIMAGTPYEHVRRHGLRLINALPKWRKLPLLITVAARPDDVLQPLAESLLDSWLAGFNRTHFVQPSKAELAHLRATLTDCGGHLSPGLQCAFLALAERPAGGFGAGAPAA